jgi:sugar diacid utilization regulator
MIDNGGSGMSYRVSDLLRIPFLKNALVLAGREGIQRSIYWYKEIYVHGAVKDSVSDTNENDILILADEWSEWTEPQILEVISEAVRCGVGCVIMFSESQECRLADECIQIAENAHLPVILISERRLPIDILSREIAMNLLQHSRSSSYLEEVFLCETGAKELSNSDLQVIKQCSGYDFDTEHQAVCIAYEERRDTARRHGVKPGDSDRIKEICMKWFSEKIGQTIAGISEQSFVIFLPTTSEIRNTDSKEQLRNLIRRLEEAISEIRFYAGIGMPRIGLENWKNSLKEARLVIRAMKIFDWDGVRTIGSVQPAALLLDIRDQGQLYRLRDPIIRPLYSIGTKNAVDSELAHTLEMYFRYGQNIRLTAEKMFLHRNTLNMRLRKIEKLCGVDLSDPVCCNEVEFAVYVEKCLLFG